MEHNPLSGSPPDSQSGRDRLLRQFETWLDRALESEEPPAGLTDELLGALKNGEPLPAMEGQCDLYYLWAAMTALTQEVKLQGRAFKQLNDTLARTQETFLQAVETNSSAPGPPAGNTDVPERGIDKRAIELLIDLRDRLVRGEGSVQTAMTAFEESTRRSRWTRWLGGDSHHHVRETLAALRKGYALVQDGLDQALVEYNLFPIACEGQPFDPQRMTAVEIEETDVLPEGTVVSEYRAGYEWNGEVYRPAQVKVARPPKERR